jgi:hypothetical protein
MKATYGLHINAVLLWAELFAVLTTGAAVANRPPTDLPPLTTHRS